MKVGGQRSDWEDSNSQAHTVNEQVYNSDCVCCLLAHSPTESVAKKRLVSVVRFSFEKCLARLQQDKSLETQFWKNNI